MSRQEDKKRPIALDLTPRRTGTADSFSSSDSSLKAPRTPRFAEATSVHSPVDGKSPFADPEPKEMSQTAQPQPSDVGFGYIHNDKRESVAVPMTPKSPLKSALRVPGTPARFNNPLSPTFREEDLLEKREALTEKEQARDLKVKTRVRMAKFALRGVNFSCSLIVLAMISTSFSIFNATKTLPAKSGMTSWASNTNPWAQKLTLAMSCVSLGACLLVFIAYCRGGHRRAEKVSTYYTMFAIGWFILSMILWAITAALLQSAKNNSKKDFWAWSCVQNNRAIAYSDNVDYALVCRLQNWTLICIIIEIVVEVICISLYSIMFYRYYTKRRLHKTMDMRDRARSDMYLAQLRMQSAPNTPGFGPKSPAFSQYAMSPRHPPATFGNLGSIGEESSPFTPGGGMHMAVPQSQFAPKSPSAFKLQAPPVKAPSATPKLNSAAFSSPASATSDPELGIATSSSSSSAEAAAAPPPPPPSAPITSSEHTGAAAPRAADEPVYDAVPIPGAYAGQAIKTPPPAQVSFGQAQ